MPVLQAKCCVHPLPVQLTEASSSGGDVVVDASRDLTFTTLTAGKSVVARARGVLSGTSASGGEDVAMRAATLTLVTAGALQFGSTNAIGGVGASVGRLLGGSSLGQGIRV